MHLLKYFKPLSLRPENAKEIRALILELAIRGRLTEEWRRENQDVEPASVLLERIREEKARLVDQKLIRKERKQSLIEESEIPYPIPSTWHWCRLGNYVRNFGQKKPDQKFTYIDVGSVDNDKGIITESTNDLNPEEAPSRARKIVEHGTVIYSTVRPYLLNIAIVSREFEYEPIASTAFAILHPVLDCPPEYLYTLLRSPYFIEYVESKMKGVAYPAINDKQMMAGLVPTPPLPEQRAIVATVNCLLAEVDELERQTTRFRALRQDYVTASLRQLTGEDSGGAWAALRPHFQAFFDQQHGVEKLRAAILELAVQGKLTAKWREDHLSPKLTYGNSDNDNSSNKPKSWVGTTLGEIFEIKSSKRIFKSEYTKSGIPFYRSKEIGELGKGKSISTELFISEEKYNDIVSKFGVVQEGDILIACIGGSIGNTWLVDDRKFYYKDGNLVQIGKSDLVDHSYLLKYLRSSAFYESALGRVSGSAYNALTIQKLKNSYFPLPPLPEQKGIVLIVDQLMALCDRLEEQIEEREAIGEDFLRASVGEVLKSA